MADHFVLLNLVLFCLVCATGSVRSQTVQINQLCHYRSNPNLVHCIGGEWPEYPISFLSNIVSIRFWDIIFRSDGAGNIQPLPATLTFLRQLDFNTNLTFVNQAGAFLPTFPLQKLTENVNRSNIATLSFSGVRLLRINKQFLAGFTGLEVLTLTRCHIRDIMTDAFESFRTLTTKTVNGAVEARSVFRRLTLNENIELKLFSWEVLTYVSSSLEVVRLSKNPDLTEITFTPIESGNVTYPPMNKLNYVSITDNPYLSVLPEGALTRGNGTGIVGAGNGTSYIEFAGNGNQCDGCALKSLIAWATELSDATATRPRELRADCRVDCKNTLSGIVPPQAGWPIEAENSTFWAEFQAQQPATCNASVTRPCAAEYNPLVTIARTTRRPSTPFVPIYGGPKPSVPSSIEELAILQFGKPAAPIPHQGGMKNTFRNLRSGAKDYLSDVDWSVEKILDRLKNLLLRDVVPDNAWPSGSLTRDAATQTQTTTGDLGAVKPGDILSSEESNYEVVQLERQTKWYR
ncbi:hypothetical protein BV898_19455 [Hypsibius exemplaris]|uniref:Uncharacterized protein n=1 Tax=Hypsibius exemplaris TaxID=2072580 RepID=A0A9X6RPL9_HYPEX|nr:hypothetical protein BV898_19455 [Hypsibius exemplaris]